MNDVHGIAPRIAVVAIFGVSVGLLSLLPQASFAGALFTVNSTNDGGDTNAGDGLCDDGTGACTLRAALQEANATPGADSIRFNVGSSGSVQTFTPASALPVIDEAVTIDGTTQPGYSGAPLIELNGSLAPSDANGLTIISGGTTVRGLVINRFGGDAGISIQLGSGGNVVQGNYVGTDVTGTIARGNSNGIYTFDSSNDLIGGFAASARNLISGNAGHGVFIQGYSGAGTVVAGNYIGTDVSGNVDLGNAGSGVWINNESPTTVGGTSAGSRNMISGNDGDGVTVYAGNGAVIQGNFIGTNAAGTAALPNTHNGVFLSTSTDNLVGGTTAAARNVISGNGSAALDAGVVILGGDELGNTVSGNYVGTDTTGTSAIPNKTGVIVSGGTVTRIGGTAAGAGNLISGNTGDGVLVQSAGTYVEGNYVGTDVTGDADLGNATGIRITSDGNNYIGACNPAGRNVVSGNGIGVAIYGPSTGNWLLNNYIGTNGAGSQALGNDGAGILIQDGSDANYIGDFFFCNGRNVVSGNQWGILIRDSSGNSVTSNFIGTNASGIGAIANGTGVQVEGDSGNNLIGTTNADARNVISGNSGPGVAVVEAGGLPLGTDVKNNYVGISWTGSPLGNGGPGILIDRGVISAIGGPGASDANVIAYNGGDGVRVIGNFDVGPGGLRNLVQGNSIYSNALRGTENLNFGNRELTPPAITAADPPSGTACPNCTIDIYSDAEDEGQLYHGSVPADGAGNWSFPGAVAGPNLTATATDADSNTSEFSQPFPFTCADADSDGMCDYTDPDDDNDGVPDGADNCPLAANPDQANADSDAQGDVCDPDDDNDTVPDTTDNCPFFPNVDQADTDGDGLGDVCDGGLGYYHPLAPYRILDTRSGPQGVPAGKLQNNSEITVDVTGGASGVPATNVSAVVINATVTEPTMGSYLTVYPTGVPRPLASNLNFSPGQTVPNLVTVKVGIDGNVKVYNNNGQVHVIFDVVGWYGGPSGGSRYNALTPARILDTRTGPQGIPAGAVDPGETVVVDVTGVGGVPANATAVVINVTATGPTSASFLTVYPSDPAVPLPTASNLNFNAGQTVPNLVAVKVGPDGNVKVYNKFGSVHVIFDVVAYYAASGDLFYPITPARVLDTRTGPQGTPAGAVGNGGTISVDVTVGAVPATASGLIVNTTVTQGTQGSFLTVWPSGVGRPPTSNLNFSAGQTVPNLVVVRIGTGGNVSVYNQKGTVHVIMDAVGYFAP